MNTTVSSPALSALAAKRPATALRRVDGAAAGSYRLFDHPAQDYHGDKSALSCSMLKPLLTSPAHFVRALIEPHAATQAQQWGIALHCLVLEPHKMGEVFAVYPSALSGRDSEVRAFKAANANKICLSLLELDVLRTAADRVRESRFRGRPFQAYIDEGEVEVSQYFIDPTTQVVCRTRPDLLHPEFTFDLKSSRHALPAPFQRDCLDLDYDMSAYVYSLARCLFDGTDVPKPFVFVQVESVAPHSIHFHKASLGFLANGAKKYQAALGAYFACERAGQWPSAGGEVDLDIEPWQAFDALDRTWLRGAS